MSSMNKILEAVGDLEGIVAIITIDKYGGIQVMDEDKIVALIFGNERAEKPYLEVRCQLDFIMYFAKLLDIPIKFKGANMKE